MAADSAVKGIRSRDATGVITYAAGDVADLFELGFEAVGDRDSRMETFADWKEPLREGVIYYLDQGQVRGVLLWNTWGKVDHARALIAEAAHFKPSDLKGRLPA